MGPISKATRARFYPFGAPPAMTAICGYCCALLPLPTHRTTGAAHRAKEKWAVSKWAPGASPRPERRARPPTDHRDWNNLTNPDLSNGDDLTVSVRYTHGAFDPVPTMPRSAKLGIRVPRLRATARRLSVVLFSCALLRAEKVLVSC
jgi:hypothetical protein